MRKLSVLLTAVAFSALAAPSAQASVVTFDSVVSVGNPIRSTPLTTDGFTFSSAHYHIIDSPGLCFGGCVSDGTQYLGLDGPTLGFPVKMTDAGGGAFDLLGLDAAKLWL